MHESQTTPSKEAGKDKGAASCDSDVIIIKESESDDEGVNMHPQKLDTQDALFGVANSKSLKVVIENETDVGVGIPNIINEATINADDTNDLTW